MARTKGSRNRNSYEAKATLAKMLRENPELEHPALVRLRICNDPNNSPELRNMVAADLMQYEFIKPKPLEDKQEQSAFEFTWIDDPLNSENKLAS